MAVELQKMGNTPLSQTLGVHQLQTVAGKCPMHRPRAVVRTAIPTVVERRP